MDQACIRFVHFSKENELRSRLFSEKMGLESGWNCHISLSAAAEETSEATDNYDESNDGSFSNGSVAMNSDKRNSKSSGSSAHKCKTNRLGNRRTSCGKGQPVLPTEEALLLPRCSSSVPEMVMLSTKIKEETEHELTEVLENNPQKNNEKQPSEDVQSVGFGFSSDEEEQSQISRVRFEDQMNINRNFLTLDVQNTERSPCSSAVISPNNTDSFQEVYELVEHPTPLGIDMSNRVPTKTLRIRLIHL